MTDMAAAGIVRADMEYRTIIISPLEEAARVLAGRADAHVCGLLGPEMDHPALPVPDERRLRLTFHDVAAPVAGFDAAREADAEAIVDFARRWRDGGDSATLMFHCWAGISRSTAAAFIARCALEPERAESDIAGELRTLAPWATPNPWLVSLADGLLGREGRMREAVSSIGRGREAFLGEVTEWPLES